MVLTNIQRWLVHIFSDWQLITIISWFDLFGCPHLMCFYTFTYHALSLSFAYLHICSHTPLTSFLIALLQASPWVMPWGHRAHINYGIVPAPQKKKKLALFKWSTWPSPSQSAHHILPAIMIGSQMALIQRQSNQSPLRFSCESSVSGGASVSSSLYSQYIDEFLVHSRPSINIFLNYLISMTFLWAVEKHVCCCTRNLRGLRGQSCHHATTWSLRLSQQGTCHVERPMITSWEPWSQSCPWASQLHEPISFCFA